MFADNSKAGVRGFVKSRWSKVFYGYGEGSVWSEMNRWDPQWSVFWGIGGEWT